MTKKKPGRPAKSEFYKLRKTSFLMMEDRCTEYFGVDASTIQQWDTEGAPVMAMRLLEMRLGHLSAVHRDWAGFRICSNGVLWGPNKARHPVWALKKGSDYHAELEQAKKEAIEAKAELEKLRRFSTPEAVQKAQGRLIWVPDYVH